MPLSPLLVSTSISRWPQLQLQLTASYSNRLHLPLPLSSSSSSSSSSCRRFSVKDFEKKQQQQRVVGPCSTMMLHHNPIVSDLYATGFSVVVAVSLLRLWEETAKRNLFDQKLNRKLVHITIGLAFILCWPLFSDGYRGVVLAALTPGVNIIRMLLIGSGMWKDDATVKSMSRYGDRRFVGRSLSLGELYCTIGENFLRALSIMLGVSQLLAYSTGGPPPLQLQQCVTSVPEMVCAEAYALVSSLFLAHLSYGLHSYCLISPSVETIVERLSYCLFFFFFLFPGMADVVGRRFGTLKLPYNQNKSVAGSVAMAVSGFVASLGFMHYFASFGFVQESWEMALGFLVVSLASALVESLPISTELDDNLTVTLTSIAMGNLIF